MENETKHTAVLEITSSSLKYAVGYSLNNAPYILSYSKMAINDCIEDGKIVNLGKLCDSIKKITDIDDEEIKLKADNTSIDLVVPPLGLNVYHIVKSTSTLKGEVSPYDINNIINLMRMEKVPVGNTIVDIQLEAFKCDDGVIVKEAPIGTQTLMITGIAKIFTLPTAIYETYLKGPQTLGLQVRKTIVSSRCSSKLISSQTNYPDTYFYVDLGGQITTITTINKGSPIGSLPVYMGGDNLTRHIAETFNIPLDAAEKIKSRYGYDTREGDYKAPILRGVREDGTAVEIQHSELNQVISSFFVSYVGYIENAIETLTNNHLKALKLGEDKREAFDKLPLIISGGTSSLEGLDMLLEKLYQKRRVIKFVPETLGARDPEATNILGCIVLGGEYLGNNQNQIQSVSLTREKK